MSGNGAGIAASVLAPINLLAGIPALVGMNQEKKAKEGAENAARDEQNQMNQQIASQKKKDQNVVRAQQGQANATSQGAMSAIRAALTASSGYGGTLLTSGQGAAPAPTTSKTLLGA